MRKTIAANIKQAVFSRSFLTGLIGVVLVILLSTIQDILTAFRVETLLPYGFHDGLIAQGVTSEAMALTLPILCTLPYTASFVDDMKSGFIKAYLPRTTVSRYITGKSIACAVSGGLVLSLGILATYFLATLVFSPMEAALAKGAEAPSYFGELIATTLMFFCSGAFWAMVGQISAALTNSKYMAYASPFVLYYLLIILYERYFNGLYILYPREWLNPSEAWAFGKYGVALLLMEFTVLLTLGFAAIAKRRIATI